jgi:predicted PurR-regulated permease PerM
MLWGALVVSTIDNVLRPLFISGKSEIPLFVVIVGALGGLAAFGFTGLLAGPVIIAIFRVLMSIYRTEEVAGHGGR